MTERKDTEIRHGIPRAFKLDVIGPDARRRESREEVAFHIDMRVEQLMKRGMTAEEARAEAIERFASGANGMQDAEQKLQVKPSRRGTRERIAEALSDAWRDTRLAVRSLMRAPSFSILALITLALGIGASTAIFSVVRGVVLRHLPYAVPSELVSVQHESMSTVAPATYLDWQRLSSSFDAMSAAEWWTPSVQGAVRVEEIDGIRVTGNHFALLGIRMTLGRAFRPEEALAEPTQVTVLSHAYWLSHFGGDSNVVGRNIVLNGRAHTIVGVMPPATPFVPFWADQAKLAVPLIFGSRATDRDGASLRVIGRLRDNASTANAAQDLAVVGSSISREFPGSDNSARLVPLHEMVVGGVRNALLGVMAAVGCVLLIACANVTHLQLMRNASRQREFAIRSAIGGTRSHLLRQSLGEVVILTVAACMLGLMIVRAGISTLVALAPSSIPRIDAVQMDGAVLAFAVGLTLLVALLLAVLPALLMDSTRLQAMLREGGASGEGKQRVRTRSVLVISEFALALVLLTTAGLVIRTVNAMHNVDAAYDPSNVLTLRVSTRGTADSTPERRSAFYNRVLERVSAMNGVEVASAVNHLPLDGDHWRFPFIVEGATSNENERNSATFRIARAGYFRAMRIDLLEGREFTAEDANSAARVVVVSKTMADRRWPGQSAIGKRISVEGAERPDWFTVIGVAEDTRQGSWTEASLEEMYFPNIVDTAPANAGRLVSMLNPRYFTIILRTNVEPSSLSRHIIAAINEINPAASVSGMTTMADVVEREFAVTRFYLTLFSAFAIVAVLLALVGVYGVLSYSVARRRRELGVRIALGAQRGDAFRLVLRQGMQMAATGAVAGIIASVLLAQLIRGLLFGVAPVDPLTILGATAVVAAIAALGCAVPAWRAARTDPLVALRD